MKNEFEERICSIAKDLDALFLKCKQQNPRIAHHEEIEDRNVPKTMPAESESFACRGRKHFIKRDDSIPLYFAWNMLDDYRVNKRDDLRNQSFNCIKQLNASRKSFFDSLISSDSGSEASTEDYVQHLRTAANVEPVAQPDDQTPRSSTTECNLQCSKGLSQAGEGIGCIGTAAGLESASSSAHSDSCPSRDSLKQSDRVVYDVSDNCSTKQDQKSSNGDYSTFVSDPSHHLVSRPRRLTQKSSWKKASQAEENTAQEGSQPSSCKDLKVKSNAYSSKGSKSSASILCCKEFRCHCAYQQKEQSRMDDIRPKQVRKKRKAFRISPIFLYQRYPPESHRFCGETTYESTYGKSPKK